MLLDLSVYRLDVLKNQHDRVLFNQAVKVFVICTVKKQFSLCSDILHVLSTECGTKYEKEMCKKKKDKIYKIIRRIKKKP